TMPYASYPGQPQIHVDPNSNQTTPRGFFEYPALTGLFAWTAAKLGTVAAQVTGRPEPASAFFYWNAAMLALLALACTWMLDGLVKDRRRILFFCAGSSLMLYAFHNWDLLAVTLTLACVRAYERRRLV